VAFDAAHAYNVSLGAYQGAGLFDYQGSTGAETENDIRNFSLRNWRRWTRKDLEEGRLPEDLREQADEAIRDAVQASVDLGAGRIPAPEALLVAMEAREAYERAYREAYASAYVAEIVAAHWVADMRRMRRRRTAAALLLLH
jgi:hypothetical protein